MAKWVGYPNTDGVPEDPVGYWGAYENSDDRVYAKRWVATEAGTITHVNVRWGNNLGFTDLWIVAYNGDNLAGYAAITSPAGDSWEGDTELTEASPGSLSFQTDDVLRFGICFDADGTCGLGRDTGIGDENNWYDTQAVSGSPTDPASWSQSGSLDGIGCILRYNEGYVERDLTVPLTATISATDQAGYNEALQAPVAASVAVTALQAYQDHTQVGAAAGVSGFRARHPDGRPGAERTHHPNHQDVS